MTASSTSPATRTNPAGARKAAPSRRSASRRQALRRLGLSGAAGILLLLIWQGVASTEAGRLLPSPVGIALAIPTVLGDGAFWGPFFSSIWAILQGLVIGCIGGTALGILIGRLRIVRGLLSPYVSGLYAMPLLALVPLMTIWLGYSSAARLAVIVIAAILPCIASTADGAKQTPRELEDVMAVLRVSQFRRLFELVLPATLPFVIAGVNVAIGRAIVGAVAVEFLASIPGIGTFILTNARTFHQNEAFVGVLLLVVVGVLAHAGVEWIRRRVAPWQHAGESA